MSDWTTWFLVCGLVLLWAAFFALVYWSGCWVFNQWEKFWSKE